MKIKSEYYKADCFQVTFDHQRCIFFSCPPPLHLYSFFTLILVILLKTLLILPALKKMQLLVLHYCFSFFYQVLLGLFYTNLIIPPSPSPQKSDTKVGLVCFVLLCFFVFTHLLSFVCRGAQNVNLFVCTTCGCSLLQTTHTQQSHRNLGLQHFNWIDNILHVERIRQEKKKHSLVGVHSDQLH